MMCSCHQTMPPRRPRRPHSGSTSTGCTQICGIRMATKVRCCRRLLAAGRPSQIPPGTKHRQRHQSLLRELLQGTKRGRCHIRGLALNFGRLGRLAAQEAPGVSRPTSLRTPRAALCQACASTTPCGALRWTRPGWAQLTWRPGAGPSWCCPRPAAATTARRAETGACRLFVRGSPKAAAASAFKGDV
jgi:hypothetical protein